MIEIWMKKHLVSDNICNTAIHVPKKLQPMTNNVGWTFSVGDNIYRKFQLVLSKAIRIGDTNYQI